MELSSLWFWPVMDMFTHSDKVHFILFLCTHIFFKWHPSTEYIYTFCWDFWCCVTSLHVHPSERLIGLPDSMLKNKSTPQVVPSLEGLFIEDIAVGCEHVLALSSTGDVYAWGCNSEGQVTNKFLLKMIHFDCLLSVHIKNPVLSVCVCFSWVLDTPTK